MGALQFEAVPRRNEAADDLASRFVTIRKLSEDLVAPLSDD